MSTRSSTADAFIVSLAVGGSSVHALLFDSGARQMEGYGAQLPHNGETDPDKLLRSAIDCLDELHRQIHDTGLRVAAVASSTAPSGFLGIGQDGKPTLPILHPWPEKLLWVRPNRPAEFAATRRWLSFPEYLFAKLFGRARSSVSIASSSGLWNQNANDYDDEILAALPTHRVQLAVPEDMDQPEAELLPEYRKLWPAFEGAQWFPSLGDAACHTVGSGCVAPSRFALTAGALRAVIEAQRLDAAPGFICHRVDRRRFLTGATISTGGDVYSWMKRTLALPKDLEARLETAQPGVHGLKILPSFSTGGAITGLRPSTEPFDIFHASLEAVALRFRDVYETISQALAPPEEVVACGAGLLRSPSWTQMMADALGRPVVVSTEPEATGRGAALWALERIGAIEHLGALPASTGAVFTPRPEYEDVYRRLLGEQRAVYAKLFGA